MLGENHSLLNEFPEFKELIQELAQSDQLFFEDMKKYDNLDSEIRELELSNSPLDDESMHKLKQERAALKDSLFQTLSNAK